MSPQRTTIASMAAWTACLLGAAYAAVSAYWAFGGTALLDTVGGAFERAGRTGSAGLAAVVWVTVVLKLLAAALGPLAVGESERVGSGPERAGGESERVCARRRRLVRRLAWTAAAILVLYGGVLSVVGWLVQLGVVHAAAHADHRAMRWHAYLWDPWFLVWGLALAGGLTLSRRRAAPAGLS